MEVKELVNFIHEKIAGREVDAALCLRVGAELAVKLNSVSNLSGSEKKDLVVKLMVDALKEIKEQKKLGKGDTTAIEEQYDHLVKTVSAVLPTSLELIVSASRGKLDLKKVKPSVWARYCSCFVKNLVTVLVSQKMISQDVAKKIDDVVEKIEDKIEAVESSEGGVGAVAAAVGSAVVEEVKDDVVSVVVANPIALQIREVAASVAPAVESSTQESKE